MSDLTVFLLLALLLSAGLWIFLYARDRRRHEKLMGHLNHRYFQGLNYLLNDESDRAIDVFIKLAETSDETFEPQLALGNLYRRKGEVERAIRLHQSLISKPDLPEPYRTRALLALGQDYMSAGLLDRAEILFSELVEVEAHSPTALKFLCEIYQQEQDWTEAIRTARRYEATSGRDMKAEIGHFYCEMADKALLEGDVVEAEKHLRQALRADPGSVRAELIRARIYQQNQQWPEAIAAYQAAARRDIDYLPEFIEEAVRCYQRSENHDALEEWLQSLMTQYPGISPVLALAEIIEQEKGTAAAAAFIAEALQERDSVRGLEALIRLSKAASGQSDKSRPVNSASQADEHLDVLHHLVQKLLAKKARHRCRNCGFTARSLHWQCPSCKSWGSVKPIYGIEHE
jgi:lipopolysaccharide biosynthesis regulator YciM